MKAIYVHLNPNDFSFSGELNTSNYTYTAVPEFAQVSLEQSERFLNEKSILITNTVIKENFELEINEFFEKCKKGFPSFYRDPFWLTTLLRLYVVYLYCKHHQISEFIHLEYDNLIYSDLSQLKQLPPSLYFTRVGPYCSSAGFVYCNSITNYEQFIKRLESLFDKGQDFVKSFTQYDHLSEMILIDLIYTHTRGVIDYLPILPKGTGSDNFDKLGAIFDGASYGQYLGGTNNGNDKGWYGQHHYVGQALHNNIIKIIFEDRPYIIVNNKKIPILNLHIHSKKLKGFIHG
jgi:hypothetical protein